MRKLFISQPMKGKTNEEILAERNRLIEKAEDALHEKFEVIDSFIKDAPYDANPLWFLGKSLELLSTADVAIFGKDWGSARGCKIENEACLEYGITVIESYSE